MQAAEAHREATPVDEVGRRLEQVERGFEPDPDHVDGVELLEQGIARSYRKGRSAMRRARSSLATPDLHRWRKAVKDLWHLLRLGRKRLPRETHSVAPKLKRLGEVLGLDHDHAMLAERLALSPDADPSLMRQLALIAGERRRLESEAFGLADQLYHRKPKGYAKRAARVG
jgi:hypothetical protein